MRIAADFICYLVYTATLKGYARKGRAVVALNLLFVVLTAVLVLNIAFYTKAYKPSMALLVGMVLLPVVSMKAISAYFESRYFIIINRFNRFDKMHKLLSLVVYVLFLLALVAFAASGIRWGRASVHG